MFSLYSCGSISFARRSNRRAVLRAILPAVLALWLPVLAAGCSCKRPVPGPASSATAGGAVVAAAETSCESDGGLTLQSAKDVCLQVVQASQCAGSAETFDLQASASCSGDFGCVGCSLIDEFDPSDCPQTVTMTVSSFCVADGAIVSWGQSCEEGQTPYSAIGCTREGTTWKEWTGSSGSSTSISVDNCNTEITFTVCVAADGAPQCPSSSDAGGAAGDAGAVDVDAGAATGELPAAWCDDPIFIIKPS